MIKDVYQSRAKSYREETKRKAKNFIYSTYPHYTNCEYTVQSKGKDSRAASYKGDAGLGVYSLSGQ